MGFDPHRALASPASSCRGEGADGGDAPSTEESTERGGDRQRRGGRQRGGDCAAQGTEPHNGLAAAGAAASEPRRGEERQGKGRERG